MIKNVKKNSFSLSLFKTFSVSILILSVLAVFSCSIQFSGENPYGKTGDPTADEPDVVIHETLEIDGELYDMYSFSGRPPKNYKSVDANISFATLQSDGAVIISNVPAFNWCYGCTPTSAAMLVGYYDNLDMTDLYTGPANEGKCPMNNSVWGAGESPISASHMGIDGRTERGNVDDYWGGNDILENDPFIANGWPEHSPDSMADFMGTSQQRYGNKDGYTIVWTRNNGLPSYRSDIHEVASGIVWYFNSRGYNVSVFNQNINSPTSPYGFTYEQYRAEINADRPVLIHLAGHTMLGIGYRDSDRSIIFHNTWDYADHVMPWGGTFSGMPHVSVTTVRPENRSLSRLNIYAVKKWNTGSGKTEMHLLNGGNNFQNFALQTSTALHPTDGNWEFSMGDWNRDGVLDLICIKKWNTGSGKTEVHVLNGANNFQSFILQTSTALHPTDGNWEFNTGDWNRDGILDLIGVKKAWTGSGKTEVHILNGADHFQSFLLQTSTGLHPTDGNWEFSFGDWNNDGILDMFGIKKAWTGSWMTEVHILNGADNFQGFILQVGTAVHTTDGSWEFSIGDWNRDGVLDLIGIKKSWTASGKTEAHILNGADYFRSFLLQTSTTLHPTGDDFAIMAK